MPPKAACKREACGNSAPMRASHAIGNDNYDKTSQFSVIDNELDTYIYAGDFTVGAKEVEKVHFQFKLENHDIDVKNNKIYMKTHVFIDHSVDAYDEDEVPVFKNE